MVGYVLPEVKPLLPIVSMVFARYDTNFHFSLQTSMFRPVLLHNDCRNLGGKSDLISYATNTVDLSVHLPALSSTRRYLELPCNW